MLFLYFLFQITLSSAEDSVLLIGGHMNIDQSTSNIEELFPSNFSTAIVRASSVNSHVAVVPLSHSMAWVAHTDGVTAKTTYLHVDGSSTAGPDMDKPMKRAAAALLREGGSSFPVICGGMEKAECQKVEKNHMAEFPPLSQARLDLTLTGLGHVLLAVGGDYCGGGCPSDVVELYKEGAWSTVASLHHARSAHSAVKLSNNAVMVCGGWDNEGTVLPCETYDVEKDEWTEAAVLKTGRKYAAMAKVDQQVMIIGGANAFELSSVDSLNLTDDNAQWVEHNGVLKHGREVFGAWVVHEEEAPQALAQMSGGMAVMAELVVIVASFAAMLLA